MKERIIFKPFCGWCGLDLSTLSEEKKENHICFKVIDKYKIKCVGCVKNLVESLYMINYTDYDISSTGLKIFNNITGLDPREEYHKLKQFL